MIKCTIQVIKNAMRFQGVFIAFINNIELANTGNSNEMRITSFGLIKIALCILLKWLKELREKYGWQAIGNALLIVRVNNNNNNNNDDDRSDRLTTPSDETESSNPRKAGIAGGVVLMSNGSQSPLEGEFPWVDGCSCLPPRTPSRGLPRRTRRLAETKSKKSRLWQLSMRLSESADSWLDMREISFLHEFR
jgi:hypothetical protein